MSSYGPKRNALVLPQLKFFSFIKQVFKKISLKCFIVITIAEKTVFFSEQWKIENFIMPKI